MATKAKRQAIRNNPLDRKESYTQTMVPRELEKPREPKRLRYTALLRPALIERFKDICYSERMTVAAWLEEAITQAADRYEKRHGGPYPKRASDPPSGRPFL